MKISVVVPVYDVPRNLLEPCLGSLAMQTLRKGEYEIIIVDDCSTDRDTIAGIGEFVEREPNASIVRHADNLGLNEARRSGVKAAEGEYVVFVDGDDPITRDGLELLRIEAGRIDADLVTAPMLLWNHSDKTLSDNRITFRPLPADYLRRLEFVFSGEGSWSMCGRLFRRGLLGDDVFDIPPNRLHEDITTFTRIALKAKAVAHCATPIYFYTQNPSSITAKFSQQHVEGILGAARDWMSDSSSYDLFDVLKEPISVGSEKLVNTCVKRCILSETLGNADKLKVLRKIREYYYDLKLGHSDWTHPAARLALEADEASFDQGSGLLDELAKTVRRTEQLSDEELSHGIGPSDMAQQLKDKIVIIGQVDYQVRSAAAFARELRLQGHPCVVLDNSGFAADGKRAFAADEEHIFHRVQHVRVQSGPYPIDWLSTAKLLIVFNDFNDDFREALEFRNQLELPSICAVEGINDFLRMDFEGYRLLPYRRCKNVFLAGEHDQKYFTDRKTYVTGLVIIEELIKKKAWFPPKPLAVLNVNFTYGALEDERDGFVQKAKEVFDAVALDWKITQHPMDKGKLIGCPASDKTQYELIDECTVFVSRFATGILEALASGKPAIYFNPHHEKVEKFKEPLGAFDIATTAEELAHALRRALKEVDEGVDFRARATEFLKVHTGWDPAGPTTSEKFAAAALDVLDSHQTELQVASELFYRSARRNALFGTNSHEQRLVIGTFSRREKARLNEEEMIGRYFGQRGKLMIDVGANFGNSLDIYLGKGWEVHAFEPDPNNRQELLSTWPNCNRLIVNSDAVSNEAGKKVAFYASGESTGISGLSAFTEGHRKIGEVETTTLADYYKSRGLSHIDFLKIDVEGFDKFVLDGFPWAVDKPEVVLAEFEDAKTIPLGYTMHDLANVLIQQGYSVYVSEWMPIIRYGIAHDWRQMLRYSPDLELGDTWGNLIGFYNDPGDEVVARLTKQSLKFDPDTKFLEVPELSGSKRWDGETINSLLSELDRLWILSLLQGQNSQKKRSAPFNFKRVAASTAEMSIQDLAQLAQKQKTMITPPDSFDDEAYLKTYPDVADAVRKGDFQSGYEHYTLFGHLENRQRPSKV
ncbi:MAG: FkbM family methyltransferase [Pseudomonadota bacterium]